jgi:hypothetical protein
MDGKIGAIKDLKALFAIGLKEAKDYVDSLERSGYDFNAYMSPKLPEPLVRTIREYATREQLEEYYLARVERDKVLRRYKRIEALMHSLNDKMLSAEDRLTGYRG